MICRAHVDDMLAAYTIFLICNKQLAREKTKCTDNVLEIDMSILYNRYASIT
jgi:hypothetical protein